MKKSRKKIFFWGILAVALIGVISRIRRRIPPTNAKITMSTELDSWFLDSTINRKKQNQEIRSQKIFDRRNHQNFRQKLTKSQQIQTRSPEDLGRHDPNQKREKRSIPKNTAEKVLPKSTHTGQEVIIDQEIRYVFQKSNDEITLVRDAPHTRSPITVQITR